MELSRHDRGGFGIPLTSVAPRGADNLLESSGDEKPRALSLRRLTRSAATVVATIVVSPLTLIAKAEERLSGRENWFSGIASLLSLVPGQIGNLLRLGFYRFTLERCSLEASFQFGTRFSHRTARVGRDVVIGADCCVGTATIGDHVLIGSKVSLLSGGRQHDVSDPAQDVTGADGVFERIHIGTNTWIGDGAIIMADVGTRCVVAAGSVVFRRVPDGRTVMGNPARAFPRSQASSAPPAARHAEEPRPRREARHELPEMED